VPPGTWLTQHGNDTAERPGTLVAVEDYIAQDGRRAGRRAEQVGANKKAAPRGAPP
jgi:hypothetical protein